MTERISTDIAIIGAGVIGMAIAERLLAEGRDVVVIDPNPPGSGASYGNAGTIADYAVMPVGSPEVLRNLPSLLFDRDSPLAIRRVALPSLAPWLLRFAAQSLPGPTRRNAAAIAALLADASPSWEALAERLGAQDIVQRRGCLYLYETAKGFHAAKSGLTARQTMGIPVELLTPAELAALEPGLPNMSGGAAFFPKAVFLSDPGVVMAALAKAVFAAAQFVQARVDRIARGANGVTLTGDGLHLTARKVIIAAGAHSKALARQAGDRVPLDTERGYHVEWDMPIPPITRPACPTSRGFYLCPMQGRLRVAGTVELGGLTAPPSPHRIAKLVQGARALFPQLGEPARDWMGFRPSMPDSLPVIGPSRAGGDIINAFGHGHIGVTLAPITGRIVADLVAGRHPSLDITPYRVDRF